MKTKPVRSAWTAKPSKRVLAKLASGEATKKEYAGVRAYQMFHESLTGPVERAGKTGLEGFQIRCASPGCKGWAHGHREWKKGVLVSESPVRRCVRHESFGATPPVVLGDDPAGLTGRERKLFVDRRSLKAPKGQLVDPIVPVLTDAGSYKYGRLVLRTRASKLKPKGMKPAKTKRYELRAEQERKWPVEIRTPMVGPGGEVKTPAEVFAELEDRPRPPARKEPTLPEVIQRAAKQSKRDRALGSFGEALLKAAKQTVTRKAR